MVNLSKTKSFASTIVLLLVMPFAAQAQDVIDFGTSGVADNGTLEGVASLTTDSRYGEGALLLPPGNDNFVQLTQPLTDLDMSGPYTFMTWFKNTSAGEKGLIGLGNCCNVDDGDPRNGYTMNITSAPQIRFWGGSTPNDNNHNTYSSTLPAINDGDWHHVAIRVQEGQVDIFFDGAIVGTNSASNIPTQPSLASINALSTNVPKIGGDGISESSTATTVMDEVRVYGSALSDQGVMDAMNNTGAAPDRLYYTFDEGNVVNIAGITVTKEFSDGLVADVEVFLSCNDGFASADSATISSDGSSYRFIVTDFILGSMDCEITEAATEGYDSDSCTFTNMNGGEYTCDLFNDALPGEFSVTKTWDISGAGSQTVV
ncbi:MAG: LamG domain-containing protein, partial [Gammaproteobacteria bacterium]|nr:LamG domain-containing protein [Gammaproteobacteria bacterium]